MALPDEPKWTEPDEDGWTVFTVGAHRAMVRQVGENQIETRIDDGPTRPTRTILPRGFKGAQEGLEAKVRQLAQEDEDAAK